MDSRREGETVALKQLRIHDSSPFSALHRNWCEYGRLTQDAGRRGSARLCHQEANEAAVVARLETVDIIRRDLDLCSNFQRSREGGGRGRQRTRHQIPRQENSGRPSQGEGKWCCCRQRENLVRRR